MKREGNEETVSNLAWLHQESIRSRGKTSNVSEGRNESRREKGSKKKENNAAYSAATDNETCLLGCKTKHRLAACPKFQNLTVSKKCEVGDIDDVASVWERITQTFARNQMIQPATNVDKTTIGLYTMKKPKQAQRPRGPAGYGLIGIVLCDYEKEKKRNSTETLTRPSLGFPRNYVCSAT